MSEGLGLDGGAGGTPDADPRHDVLAALDAVRADLGWLREAADRAWALSEEELLDSVAGGYQTLAAYQSTLLSLVKVLDERPEAVAGLSQSRPAAAFLQQRMRLDPSRADADVRAAHALDPLDGELAEVGAAFAAGEITREHAVTCVRVLERLPRKLLILDVTDPDTGETASGMQVVDRVLARFAREAQVRTVKQLVDQLVALLDPDRKERFDEDAHLRRSFRLIREDSTGMGLLRMALTPAHAAMLAAAVKAWSKPLPPAQAEYTDGAGAVQTTLVRDERTLGQRQYDAVMAAVLAGMTGDRTGLATLPRVDLSLLATTDQLAAAGLDMATVRERLADRLGERDAGAWTAGVDDVGSTVAEPAGANPSEAQRTDSRPDAFDRNGSATEAGGRHGAARPGPGLPTLSGVGAVGRLLFGYLSCNAALTRILLDDLGHPLDVGRAKRLATDAQRKALAVRDGGCFWPTCAVPFEGTVIHHFHEWQHGGPTDLGNMGACCERHHLMLHMGIGEAKLVDGHVHVRLPKWLDPEQRWLRNTAHRATDTATRLGQQLAFVLDLDRRETARIDAPEFDPHCWERPSTSGPPDAAGPRG